MFAQFIEVAVGCSEVEPSMPVRAVFHVGQTINFCCGELGMCCNNVVYPESSDGAGVEVIVFSWPTAS
jgi:hypothetical protein